MHGVKRDRSQQSAEIREQRKSKEAQKVQLYKSIEEQFFTLKQSGVVTSEALELTGQLLRFNPELYTAWNYRRKILKDLFDKGLETASERDEQLKPGDIFANLRNEAVSSSSVGVNDETRTSDNENIRKRNLLSEDLDLTIEVLRIHPKVYWIWNHRKWCLQQIPSQNQEGIAKWKVEIRMVDKMLDMDSRNCEVYMIQS